MEFVPAKYFYPNGNRPRLVVIHDMEYPKTSGAAEWCAKFFAWQLGGEGPQSSAHFSIDNDSIVQSVKETDGAWHCKGFIQGQEVNRISIGIEHAGYAHQTETEWRDAYGSSMLQQSARLVADLCTRHGIPPVRLSLDELHSGASGICGHNDIVKATGTGDHVDPGAGFPWDWYIGLVRAGVNKDKPNVAVHSTHLPFLVIVAAVAMVGTAGYLMWKKPAFLPEY